MRITSTGLLVALLGTVNLTFGTALNAADPSDNAASEDILEEVIVTATRRETALIDTAMSISAFSGEDLDDMGWTTLEEFVGIVPGVTSLSGGPTRNRLVMRGISNSMTSEGQATTAIYLDDFPLPDEARTGNLKLLDMQRIEVLKGPQGTLYGKSAMGGVIRYITNKPSMERVSSGFVASYSNTAKSDDNNYDVSGYINIPLSDNFAIRATAYHFVEAGFIDSVPITGQGIFSFLPTGAQPGELLYPGREDINDATYTGGRLSIRWQPADNVTIDAVWITQSLDSGGIWDVNPSTPWTSSLNALDDLLATHPYDSWSIDSDFDQLNLSIQAEFDKFDLTAHYAHNEIDKSGFSNSTLFVSNSVLGLGDSFDIPGMPSLRPGDLSGDTAEIRLVSKSEGPFNWILGSYYEDNKSTEGLYAVNDSIRASEIFGAFFGTEVGDLLLDSIDEASNDELAFYGEMGYEFTEKFALTVGYRRADVSQYNVSLQQDGPFGNPFIVGLKNESSEIANTYKILAEFRPSDQWLLYALASSGYRGGGKNPQVLGNPGNPYGSDSLWNYELGAKGTWLDGRVSLAASIYRMDWTDMQLLVTLPGGSNEVSNVGKARIDGIEGELRFNATENLSLGLNFSKLNPELREEYNPTLNPETGVDSLVGDEGLVGDRLPGSLEESFAFLLDYARPIGDGYGFFTHLRYNYVGDRTVDFNPVNSITFGHPDYYKLPSYNITDLVVGLSINRDSFKDASIEIYANNLFDERAAVGYWNLYSDQVFVNRPRTVGVRLRMDF